MFTEEDTDHMPQEGEVPISDPLTEIIVTPEMIKKKMVKLRTDKSPGPDGVHPLMLKGPANIPLVGHEWHISGATFGTKVEVQHFF